MAECKIKRWFFPLWKFEALNDRLASEEKEGWRLEKIGGLCRYTFRKSEPKDVHYFLTCNYDRDYDLAGLEEDLKKENAANPIPGTFRILCGLNLITLWRITDDFDPTVKYARLAAYLGYVLSRRILRFSIFLVPMIAGAVCVPSSTGRLGFSLLAALFLAGVVYNTVGMIDLRRYLHKK